MRPETFSVLKDIYTIVQTSPTNPLWTDKATRELSPLVFISITKSFTLGELEAISPLLKDAFEGVTYKFKKDVQTHKKLIKLGNIVDLEQFWNEISKKQLPEIGKTEFEFLHLATSKVLNKIFGKYYERRSEIGRDRLIDEIINGIEYKKDDFASKSAEGNLIYPLFLEHERKDLLASFDAFVGKNGAFRRIFEKSNDKDLELEF